MQSDAIPNLSRRLAGPLALVSALTLALAPGSALAAPSKPKPKPTCTCSQPALDYYKITMRETLVTS